VADRIRLTAQTVSCAPDTMRVATAADGILRYRKPLVITLLGFVAIAVLYSWVALDSSFVTYIGSTSPKLPERLGNIPPGTADLKGDKKPSENEPLTARKQLGSDVNRLFAEYRPPIAALNQTFQEKWPTMKPFARGKKYDYKEIAAASTDFLIEEEVYVSFREQQQALMSAVPAWESVSKAFSGRGVVICAGSAGLVRVWPHVALMLRSLKSSLPIEVWTKDEEECNRTLPMVKQMQTELGMAISVHSVSDYVSVGWSMFDITSIYKVKALALLFSSFEEAILFDSDSVPVMDPIVAFDSEEAKSGLIQWPVRNTTPAYISIS
jgi:hypothetical protein